VQQVQRRDVEGRRHADAAAVGDQPLGHVEAGLAVEKTGVDVRSRDLL